MNSQRRHPAISQFLPLAVLFLMTVCAGCASYGGSSPSDAGAAPPEIELLAPRLIFSNFDRHAQQGAGFTVMLDARNGLPQLYYSYRVESAVNGNYFMMPAPPKIYRVYRVPFYKTDQEYVTVKFTITNNSDSVLQVGKAVCAFDLNGKTVISTPMTGPDVLPGHTDVFNVQGPDYKQFAEVPAHGTLTLWLYGLGEQEHAYSWNVAYQYSETKSQEQAELIGTTSDKAIAKSYEGREEPAHGSQPGSQ